MLQQTIKPFALDGRVGAGALIQLGRENTSFSEFSAQPVEVPDPFRADGPGLIGATVDDLKMMLRGVFAEACDDRIMPNRFAVGYHRN